MIAVIGGSKVSTKLTVLKELLNKVDVIIVGGGIANTFLKSSGFEIGQSLFEEGMINKANEIIKIANKKKKKFLYLCPMMLFVKIKLVRLSKSS